MFYASARGRAERRRPCFPANTASTSIAGECTCPAAACVPVPVLRGRVARRNAGAASVPAFASLSERHSRRRCPRVNPVNCTASSSVTSASRRARCSEPKIGRTAFQQVRQCRRAVPAQHRSVRAPRTGATARAFCCRTRIRVRRTPIVRGRRCVSLTPFQQCAKRIDGDQGARRRREYESREAVKRVHRATPPCARRPRAQPAPRTTGTCAPEVPPHRENPVMKTEGPST